MENLTGCTTKLQYKTANNHNWIVNIQSILRCVKIFKYIKKLSETSENSLPISHETATMNNLRNSETYTLITFLLAAYSATPYATLSPYITENES